MSIILFFLTLSGFASVALTKVAVHVKGFPNESVPVPFHSVPLLTPLRRVAVAGMGSSVPVPLPGKPPIPGPGLFVVSGVCPGFIAVL